MTFRVDTTGKSVPLKVFLLDFYGTMNQMNQIIMHLYWFGVVPPQVVIENLAKAP